MTMKEFWWWLYLLVGVLLLLFVAPILISAPSTGTVILAIALLVVYARWSWKFWIAGSINKLKEVINEDDVKKDADPRSAATDSSVQQGSTGERGDPGQSVR